MQKCCTFLHYCKVNFGVRNLCDIKSEYFIQFISDNNYKEETAKGYKWAVQKLQNGYNTVYSTNYVWATNIYKENVNKQAIKDRVQMSVGIHNIIIKNAYMSKCTNGLAFDIARALGLRVSEITNLRMNDFKFDKNNNLKEIYIYRSKRRETQKNTH